MTAKLTSPGWYRAALYVAGGIAFSIGLLTGIRAISTRAPTSVDRSPKEH